MLGGGGGNFLAPGTYPSTAAQSQAAHLASLPAAATIPAHLLPIIIHHDEAEDDAQADTLNTDNLSQIDEDAVTQVAEDEGLMAPLRLNISVAVSVTGDNNRVSVDQADTASKIAHAVSAAVKMNSAGEMGWMLVDDNGTGRRINIAVDAGVKIEGANNWIGTEKVENRHPLPPGMPDFFQQPVADEYQIVDYGMPVHPDMDHVAGGMADMPDVTDQDMNDHRLGAKRARLE